MERVESLSRQIKGAEGPAPVHLWDPPYCGEVDMRIGSDGTWYYEGSPITRLPMVKLFSSVLRLDEDGYYYLVTPVEKVRIQVDDCPFIAQLLEVRGSGRAQELLFTTNTEEQCSAGPDHPIRVGSNSNSGLPHPEILLRTNLYALIHRNVFYQLADLAVPDETDESRVGVWSKGAFFVLGPVN